MRAAAALWKYFRTGPLRAASDSDLCVFVPLWFGCSYLRLNIEAVVSYNRGGAESQAEVCVRAQV